MNSASRKRNESDVIILGSGIAGSTLALALARNGLNVQLIDKSTHPRFALGESTVPPASFYMTAIAKRWNVPELHQITTAEKVNSLVSASCGVKKSFGFLYHAPGHAEDLRSWFFPVPGNDEITGESHLFRQDIDAFLHNAAVGAGVSSKQRTSVTKVSIDEHCVVVSTDRGEEIRGKFIIDAGGFTSVLADQFNLREQPTRLKTMSRCLFTHMIGVPPYDDFYKGRRNISPWHSGTLHHCFDGGWVWVIPFDNHSKSRNRLCSVGLSLDLRRFPKQQGRKATDEWDDFLGRFPSIARQFENARPVFDWIDTGRIQHSTTQTVGDRYWITAHAGGAVDALYSRGLLNNFQSIHTAIYMILQAFQEDDFSAGRFELLDRQARNLLEIQDSLVYGSYTSMCCPRLLDKWLEIWLFFEHLSELQVLPALEAYTRTDDLTCLNFDFASPQHCVFHYDEALPVLRRFVAIMSQLEAGKLNAVDTLAELQKVDGLVRLEEKIKRNRREAPILSGDLSKLGLEHYRWPVPPN